MEKKWINQSWGSSSELTRILRIMKLTIFIFFVALLQVPASTYSQNTKLKVVGQDLTLEEIFDMIKNQSDFSFFYNSNQFDHSKRQDINIENQLIDKILNEVLNGTELTYTINNKLIIIHKKNEVVDAATQPDNFEKKITGKVTDQTGASLPGVSVVIKGTTTGVITDNSGNYSLSNVPENAMLQFSFIGMKTQEISVGQKTSITVVMQADQIDLDEVVVIGYGTAKRSEYAGSVSSVKMEESPVSLLPNQSALESLKGNVPGLNIGATNTAGGQPEMLIRGQNSINGSNTPLIILDGVIYTGGLNDINPNDIASFDILKDAVSAAAYGSRAANGIIAITTKRGNSQKPVITFNASTGIQTWQNRPHLMNGEEYISSYNAHNQLPEGTTSWLREGELANYNAGQETNWLDVATQVGVIQDYQIAVSGAGEGINYYLSTSYNSNKGVVIGDDFDRISIFGKINTDITKWLKIGADANFSKRDYSGVTANIAYAQNQSPFGVRYRDDQGNLEKYPREDGGEFVNPLWGVNDGTTENMDVRNSYRLNTFASIDIPWIKGLNYRMNYQINSYQHLYGTFYYEDYYVLEGTGIDRYSPSISQGFLAKANGALSTTNYFNYVWDNIINYKNVFGKHSIEATLVATRDYSKDRTIQNTGSDFSDNGNTTLGLWGLHKATVQKIGLDGTEVSNIGYLGRLSYSFENKYYFTGSFRRDGASVFGADRKWGNFAAAGIAWKISRENFLKNFKPMDDLKLKLAWGQNGNQGISPYATLSQVKNGSSGGIRYEFSDSPGKIYYGLIQSTLGNADLGWESTESWNTGFESAWLKNRLFVEADMYFSKNNRPNF